MQGVNPDAGMDDMDTEGPGALETGERLEGSPAPEDIPRQPLAAADAQTLSGMQPLASFFTASVPR